MAETNQYTWKFKELVTLMIKEAGIHEGRWWLFLNFGIGPGNFGPTEAEISPGIVVAVNNIGIQREQPGIPAPSALVVDAAEVNPEPKAGRKPAKR